uniref:transglycosylase domain-containing protein n=1 Tax=Candidatus Electronema sp. TaxID=2698783 RepID=UPI004055E1CA
SVKRPNFYNPFIKKDKFAAAEARRASAERVAYVLGRMRELGMISQQEHDAARQAGLHFKRGRTSFDLTSIMDMVRNGLNSKAMTEMLEQHGIDNIATSGAKIITTVDQALQEETLYSLRRELSRLDVQLRGYSRDEVQQECRDAAGGSLEESGEIKVKSFLFGTVREVSLERAEVAVSFGPKHPGGLIDRQGLEHLLAALVKHRRQQWAKPGKKDLADLLNRLKPGDTVYVSVREADPFDGGLELELERYPKLQGAALVLRQGAVRALAGGIENRFFNRAADAKRLMGSTLKPFLYAAALQLGWSPLDHLDNRRRVFVFRDQAYFPRPDHKSPHSHVSMSWAGVKSENVASVWLLYHLTDKLTPAGLSEAAAALDMTQRSDESYQDFSRRMRDGFGLRVTEADLDCAAYEQAVRRAGAALQFEGRQGELSRWKTIGCGQNYGKYRARIQAAMRAGKLTAEEKAEYRQQLSLLGGGLTWPDLRRRRQQLESWRRRLAELPVPAVQVESFFPDQGPSRPFETDEEEDHSKGRMAVDSGRRLVFTLRASLPESWQPVSAAELRRRLVFMSPAEQDMLWSNVLLEGSVSAGGADVIARLTEEERALAAARPPYALENLVNLRDYRVMLGLQYLIRLAREAGVISRMEPVLSFPLGSNVITLMESAHMYEALVTGSRWSAELAESAADPGEEDRAGLDGLALIERIERPDGRVIYARQPAARTVFDPKSSSEIGSILQNVVRHGTGRSAWESVRLPSVVGAADNKKKSPALPLLGKTGTANDFRNAAFLGFVPTETDIDGTALLAAAGFTVGVYVGFDANEPMKRGGFRVSGSAGALPVWNRIAGALLRLEGVADRLDPAAFNHSSVSLRYPETGQLFMPVDPKSGGRMRRGKDGIQTGLSP